MNYEKAQSAKSAANSVGVVISKEFSKNDFSEISNPRAFSEESQRSVASEPSGINFEPILQPKRCAMASVCGSCIESRFNKFCKAKSPKRFAGKLFIAQDKSEENSPTAHICALCENCEISFRANFNISSAPTFLREKTTTKSPKQKPTIPNGAAFVMDFSEILNRTFAKISAKKLAQRIGTHIGICAILPAQTKNTKEKSNTKQTTQSAVFRRLLLGFMRSFLGNLRPKNIQKLSANAKSAAICGANIFKKKSKKLKFRALAVIIFVRFEKMKKFEPKSLTKLTHSKKLKRAVFCGLFRLLDSMLDSIESIFCWSLKSAKISGDKIKIAPSFAKNADKMLPKITKKIKNSIELMRFLNIERRIIFSLKKSKKPIFSSAFASNIKPTKQSALSPTKLNIKIISFKLVAPKSQARAAQKSVEIQIRSPNGRKYTRSIQIINIIIDSILFTLSGI